MAKITLLVGLAAGAGAMYLLDPKHGHERRARLSDEAQRLRETLSDEEGHVDLRDVLNRTKESVSDFRHRFSNGQREKVTSEIREAAMELGSISRWSPGTRILAGAAGSALVLYGIRRTSLVGLGVTATGLGLLGRAITNFELRKPSEGRDRFETTDTPKPRTRRDEKQAGMMEQTREQTGARRSTTTGQDEVAERGDQATAQDVRDRMSEERAALSDNPDSIPPD